MAGMSETLGSIPKTREKVWQISVFEASLIYISSSWPVRDKLWSPASKQKKTQTQLQGNNITNHTCPPPKKKKHLKSRRWEEGKKILTFRRSTAGLTLNPFDPQIFANCIMVCVRSWASCGRTCREWARPWPQRAESAGKSRGTREQGNRSQASRDKLWTEAWVVRCSSPGWTRQGLRWPGDEVSGRSNSLS